MRIAVIGAGISGLTAAHVLRRIHEVVVFEADSRPGGHAHTVEVSDESGHHALDTGFIVFNDRNYPCFETLLSQLSVASQPSDMSFGVSDPSGELEYNGASPNGLFANRRHLVSPSFHRMIADLLRFNREARRLLADDGAGPSLAEWLAERRFSAQFVEKLLVPQVCAVWSTQPRQMWSFPARMLVEFFDSHGMLRFTGRPKWRTIVGGSRRYVQALVRPLGSALRLGCPVRGVRREADAVVLATPFGAERFDQVVVATHADQALAMLEDPSLAEREVLGAIGYAESEAVLHRDERMLPRRRRAWASWNYHLVDPVPSRPTVTYHLNRLQALDSDAQFCVTLNRTKEIDPEKVIESVLYAHPVFTAQALAAQGRWAQVSGTRRTHYCGAYWRHGFHEDGVVSALRVAGMLGGAL